MSLVNRTAVSLVLVVMLVAVLGGAAQAAPAIRGIGVRWTPSTVTVSHGSYVRWRGVLKFHDVVSFGRGWRFDEALPVGTVVRRRFRYPGTYRFRCTYHSTVIGNTCTGMCGSVVVTY